MTVSTPTSPVVWRWSAALLGATCSLPAAIVTLDNPSTGLALAFGAIPAAAVGVHGPRRSRYVIVVVGVGIGLGLVTGAVLSQFWLLALSGLFVLCLGAAVLSAHYRAGALLMTLAVPMVGAGLSFDGDVAAAGELAIVMAAGSIYGWLVSLCWPEPPAPARAATTLPARAVMLEYGVRLGLAGVVCAAVGYALDLDHKGWAATACLLVMRPAAEMTRLRAVGRAVSVTAGALAGAVLAAMTVEPAVIAAAVVIAVTCLAALRTSRWYLTGGFTTFIVILLSAYGSPEQAPGRFVERSWETLFGVGIALLFGAVLPVVRRPRRDHAST